METNVGAERRRFVMAFASGAWSMTELCARFGISRPTGYKWLARHAAEGEDGLRDRSRAPLTCPHRTPEALTAQIVAARKRYGWGAGKLLGLLETRQPTVPWPARSTCNDVLAREHLLRRHRRRPHWAHPGAGHLTTAQPNQIWPADFKGQFRTGDGAYCYPLTVTDHFSRAVLLCRGLRSTSVVETQAAFVGLFRRVGLPEAIRTDNGVPFASAGLSGLSTLNVWWMQQGIVHQRIRPGAPQENGTHERMHRDLKRETARPPAATLRAQQARFEAFRHRYNEVRPHEALANATPSSRWQPPTRTYAETPAAPEYPGHCLVRRVCDRGRIKWHNVPIFLSSALNGQDVGLEEVEDGIWNLLFYGTLLGRFDERTGTVISG
jgi:transposase InsO family protein